MSDRTEEIKKTRIREAEDSLNIRASGETRIYDAGTDGDGKSAKRHTWIGEPGDRSTIIAGNSDEAGKTRIVSRGDAQAGPAKVTATGGPEESFANKAKNVAEGAGTALGKARDIGSSAARAGRRAVRDVKNVKVADKKRFGRFLKIIGVLLVLLLIEIGYFVFASHVKGMPAEIKETQKELELTKEENKLLEEEIEALGDHDSVEELKASWERLKDKIDKAAVGTYY